MSPLMLQPDFPIAHIPWGLRHVLGNPRVDHISLLVDFRGGDDELSELFELLRLFVIFTGVPMI